jgi:hypothetical protein
VASTVGLTKDGGPLEKLATEAITDPLPADGDPLSCLTPACPDPLHPPMSESERLCFANATFVDDNGVTGCQSTMQSALRHQSIRSVFMLFGYPSGHRRQSCLNDNQWDPFVSHIMAYLGFIINSRDMTVTWPLEKRLELRQQILEILARSNHKATPKEIASVIGKIPSAAMISPWGNYLSFTSQDALTAALRKAFWHPRWFWKQGRMRFVIFMSWPTL